MTLIAVVENSRFIHIPLKENKASIGWLLSNLRLRVSGATRKFLAIPKTFVSRKRRKSRLGKATKIDGDLSTLNYQSYVINLKREPARLRDTLVELSQAGLTVPTVFEAVDGIADYPELGGESGRRGCAESHIRALETHLLGSPSTAPLVFEDDIIFTSPLHVTTCLQEFLLDETLDVLCLHGYYTFSLPISDHLSVSTQISSAAAYAIKPWAIEGVLERFRRSARMYDDGYAGARFNVEISWQPLQWKSLVFAVPTLPLARQRAGFSSTEQRFLGLR